MDVTVLEVGLEGSRRSKPGKRSQAKIQQSQDSREGCEGQTLQSRRAGIEPLGH